MRKLIPLLAVVLAACSHLPGADDASRAPRHAAIVPLESGRPLIALALGAQAVLLGRPWVYGLGLAGQRGVEHVLRGMLGDFDITLALAGYSSPTQLHELSVVREG